MCCRGRCHLWLENLESRRTILSAGTMPVVDALELREGQWDGCALLDFVALRRGDINSERLGRKVLFLGRQDSCDAARDDACLAPCAEISTDFPDELLESRMSRKDKVGEPRQWDINVSRQWMKRSRRL